MTPSKLQEKFLLYIDILGFSALVERDPRHALRIYRIIEELHAHKHDYFRTLVFSDTILVYNRKDALLAQSKEYIVMYMIEFAQDLFYRFAGKGYFFRALLTHGEFDHSSTTNFDRIFGRALIRAYQQEKSVKCTGLFVDSSCQRYNKIFPVQKHESGLYFAYFNQVLEAFYKHEWPLSAAEIINYDYAWRLAADVAFLKEVHSLMNSHPDGGVRQKMQRTWEFYWSRYPRLLKDLEEETFSLSVLSTDLDWRRYNADLQVGHRGLGVEPPTAEGFTLIIDEARTRGQAAAKIELQRIYGDDEPGAKFYAPCGGAQLILDIDARSRLGRFLKKMASSLEGLSLYSSNDGLCLQILGMHHHQERDVDIAAQNAALTVLQAKLGIEGLIKVYYD